MPNCCPTCVREMYGSGVDPTTLVYGTYVATYQDETDIPCSLNNTANFSYVGVQTFPNSSDYDLYRRKWNYVKNIYSPSYQICEKVPSCSGTLADGEWYDSRSEYTSASNCDPAQTPNVAYWLDYNKFQREFYEHLFDWTEYAASRGTGAIMFEKFVQWKYEFGSSTTLYGNLPQHKRNDHYGHCWMLCPYDENNDEHRMRALLGLEDAQWPIEGRNDHGIYYMKTANRGTVWGFECTSPTCPYLTTYSGTYFYS